MTKKTKKPPASKPAFDPNKAATYDGLFGLPYREDESKVVLIGAPWNATTSYGGATDKGPKAIYDASMQVDLYDPVMGNPHEAGIYLVPPPRTLVELNRIARANALPILKRGGDIGDSKPLKRALKRVNAAGETLNRLTYRRTQQLLKEGRLVGVVGGDHSVPFGAIRAYAERYPGMGILHLDAHADLREAFEGFTWSHASIMHNVVKRLPGVTSIVPVGVRDFCEQEAEMIRKSGGRIVDAFLQHKIVRARAEGRSWVSLCTDIAHALPPEVYLSFDIDGLNPAECPHTGTPVPGGPSLEDITTLLQVVAQKHTIIGFDLCEVAPGPDGDEWDGNVGARLLYKMIGYALLSQRNRTAR